MIITLVNLGKTSRLEFLYVKVSQSSSKNVPARINTTKIRNKSIIVLFEWLNTTLLIKKNVKSIKKRKTDLKYNSQYLYCRCP